MIWLRDGISKSCVNKQQKPPSFFKIHLLIILLILLTGCKEKVLHNLSETDANRVFAALSHSGIESTKEFQTDGKWSIAVDSSEMVPALRILGEKRIVKSDQDTPPKKSSMISSRETQRFEYERGLSQEIERTLLSIEGVLDARVHLNLPQVDPILGTKSDKDSGSASVLLIAQSDFSIDKLDLAQLVSGASGVISEKISILVTKSEPPLAQTLSPVKVPPTWFSQTWFAEITPTRAEVFGGVMFSTLVFCVVMFGITKLKGKQRQRIAKLHTQFEAARFKE